ncbi:MAG TPA: pitrilysin family protein [Gemmatimonadaceae bacterium]|nr:pitrilysin family protein [Gemmatimonadaceae bacterium]
MRSSHRMRNGWLAVVGLALAAPVVAGAQARAADRADAAPVIVPVAVDSLTAMYDVGGVRVIHRRNTANDVVAANVYLLGGVRQTTAANAGIEPFLLQVSEHGTRDFDRDRIRGILNRAGSALLVSASADWTVFGLRAIRTAFDSTWAVLANRLMFPRLDSASVELVRRQYLLGLNQRADSPDALVEFMADSFAFAGHPYARPPTGTVASIANITRSDLRAYQRDQIVKSRLLVVIVGNVDRPTVERAIEGTLAALPAGDYTWSLPDPLPRHGSGFVIESRALPTNYILGYYAGPPAGSPDYPALRVATAVLSGQLFGEIRSRRNLTYAVDAPFVERAIAAGGLYVTTTAPDTVIALMRQQVFILKQGLINADALERLIAQFITEYYLDNETNADQANMLTRAFLYHGDPAAADRFVDDLRRVTPEDIQRVTRRYVQDVRFGYVGNPEDLSPRTRRGF